LSPRRPRPARCAIPAESAAPYLDQEQLYAIWTGLGLPAFSPVSAGPRQDVTQEQIDAFEFDDANMPTTARSEASYQGTGYTPINFGTSDVEAAIAADHEVVLDITTKWSQDGSGVWQYDASVTDAQGHCVLVVGYDRNAQIFTFKNSWGGTSLSQMSYDCLQNIACGATTLDSAVDPAVGPQHPPAGSGAGTPTTTAGAAPWWCGGSPTSVIPMPAMPPSWATGIRPAGHPWYWTRRRAVT
jgi:Papain family cysteine protease